MMTTLLLLVIFGAAMVFIGDELKSHLAVWSGLILCSGSLLVAIGWVLIAGVFGVLI